MEKKEVWAARTQQATRRRIICPGLGIVGAICCWHVSPLAASRSLVCALALIYHPGNWGAITPVHCPGSNQERCKLSRPAAVSCIGKLWQVFQSCGLPGGFQVLPIRQYQASRTLLCKHPCQCENRRWLGAQCQAHRLVLTTWVVCMAFNQWAGGGFQELESFWGSHSMEDPKLDGNPAMHESWQHVFGTCLNPIFFPSDVQHAAFRRGVANTCHWCYMGMVVLFKELIASLCWAWDPSFLQHQLLTARCSWLHYQNQQCTSLTTQQKTPCIASGLSWPGHSPTCSLASFQKETTWSRNGTLSLAGPSLQAKSWTMEVKLE